MRGAIRVACAGALVTTCWLGGTAHGTTGPAPTDLVVDGRIAPLDAGADPRFGWLPHSAHADDVQSAYEVVVRDGRTSATVWDSGRVASSEQSYVQYAGTRLASGHQYAWTVRTWNRAGEASPYAVPAYFDTGIGDGDWSGAQWIRRVTTGHDSTIDYTLARADFAVASGSPVQRARAYVTAEGEWQLHVNGHTVDTQYNYAMPGEGMYAAEDITSLVRSGPLAIGVKYAAWPTTNAASRPEGPVPFTTTLASAASVGETTVHAVVGRGFAPRENIAIGTPNTADFEIATIASMQGGALTLTAPLAKPHAAGAAVVSENGPSGLLVKVVVEHEDGSLQTFVSSGRWRVTKDTSEDNSVVQLRSQENAGTYVEYVDARRAMPGWDLPGYDASRWQPAAAMGAHPLPNPGSCASFLNGSSPCGFTHLNAMQSKLAYGTVHPVDVFRMRDGNVLADFGNALVGIPVVHFAAGAAGRAVTLRGSYRRTNTTLASPAAPLTSVISVQHPCRFQPGDRITVDAPADGYGAGDPEQRTVVRTTGGASCAGGALTLDQPLAHAHLSGRWVEGSRAGTTTLDTQATNLAFHYTERAGAQTTTFFVGQGFRYLEISGAGEPLTAAQIWVTTTHEDAPPARAATFHSSNATLDAVFALMQRSALYAGQQQFHDSPDRQDGQFLGDAVNESFATMESLGERTLTRQAVADFALSQRRFWPDGRVNAVYPSGDGKRDIPDFTEMYPEWVWRYYLLTGDERSLALAYPTMQRIAAYVTRSIATSGPAKGLVYQLAGGNSNAYRFGIVDWPEPMRYDTTVLNAGVDTVVNMRAVEVFRATADAAAALGHSADATTWHARAAALGDRINATLVEPTGFYDDGLLPDTGTQISNHSEHDQTFAVAYGVAPPSSYQQLGDYVATQGMKQGPLTLGQLEQALIAVDRPDALVALLTNPNADGPAKIIAEGGTSMWEQWNPGCLVPGGHPGDTTEACRGPLIFQQVSDSFSHGWGSVGIVGILRGLLGITVTSPGAATVRIAPPRGGLTSAAGTEWTERGPVSADWRKDAGGYTVTVDIPDNVVATVAIPGHAPVTVGSGRTTVSAG